MNRWNATNQRRHRACATVWIGIVGIVSLALAGAASAVGIAIEPVNQTVVLGQTVQTDIAFTDLAGEVISAYDLDLTYDPNLLAATGVTFTTALGEELFFEAFNDFDLTVAGVVDLAQLSLLSDAELAAIQPGDRITVATLVFDTLATGTSQLGFVFDAFNDVKGSNGAVLPLTVQTASIRVSAPVPEPSSALLFLVGTTLIHARFRRKPRRGHAGR